MTIDNLKEINDVKENIKELEEYCNELIYLSQDKEYIMNMWNEDIEKKFEKYQQESLRRMDKEDAKKEALKEKEKLVIANMLKLNMDINTISQVVELPVSSIEEVINDLKKE